MTLEITISDHNFEVVISETEEYGKDMALESIYLVYNGRKRDLSFIPSHHPLREQLEEEALKIMEQRGLDFIEEQI